VNNDGCNDNYSWNCGHEGESNDPEVNALRSRQMKKCRQPAAPEPGYPMLLMGDEVGRTQRGNNNAYCHDSMRLGWIGTRWKENRNFCAF